jgi:hypothetical protein
MRGKSHLREYFESLIFSVVVVLFVRTFVAEAVQIPTGSMEDTLLPGDYMSPFQVPADHFFVMGDNRDRSFDSRFWGTLPRDQIIGRPLFVWWSFDNNGSDGDFRLTDKVEGFFTRFVGQTRWGRTGKGIY